MKKSRLMVWIILGGLLLLLTFPPGRLMLGQEERPGEEKYLTFNFENTPIETVLNYISQETGLMVINEAGASGRVNAVSARKIPMSEVLDFLNSILRPQGFTAVKIGNIVKIITIEKAIKESGKIKVCVSPDEISETDEVITVVIPLRNITVERANTELKGFLPKKEIEILTSRESNSMIVTGPSREIRRFIKLIKSLEDQIISEFRPRQGLSAQKCRCGGNGPHPQPDFQRWCGTPAPSACLVGSTATCGGPANRAGPGHHEGYLHGGYTD